MHGVNETRGKCEVVIVSVPVTVKASVVGFGEEALMLLSWLSRYRVKRLMTPKASVHR